MSMMGRGIIFIATGNSSRLYAYMYEMNNYVTVNTHKHEDSLCSTRVAWNLQGVYVVFLYIMHNIYPLLQTALQYVQINMECCTLLILSTLLARSPHNGVKYEASHEATASRSYGDKSNSYPSSS